MDESVAHTQNSEQFATKIFFLLGEKISQLNSNKSFFFGLVSLREQEVISVIIILVGKVVKLSLFSVIVLSSDLLR